MISSANRRTLILAVLILLLAFGLRAHRLGLDSIWWDEGYSVWMARKPLVDMAVATVRDAHPPVYYGGLHVWLTLAGEGEFALRLPSVFFGLLAVAFAFRLGKEAGGAPAGLAAALLTAIAHLQVWWSQEIRMYALATLWATLSLWLSARLLTRGRPSWWLVPALIASNAGGLLTIYLYAGAMLVQNLAFPYAFAVARRRWRLLAQWVVAQAGSVLLFLPWAWYALARLPSWRSPQPPVSFRFVIELYLSTILTGITSELERYTPILIAGALAIIAAAVLSLWRAPRSRRPVWLMLLIATLLPAALVYLLSLPRSQFNYPTPSPRYFLLLSAPTYALLGWGLTVLPSHFRCASNATPLSWLRQRLLPALPWLPLVLLIALFGWGLTLYYPSLHLGDDYISMAATLNALRRPDDVVLLHNDQDWPVFAYHYTGSYDRISHTTPIIDEKYAQGLLGPYRGGNALGVWLIQTRYAEASDPNNYLGYWADYYSWNSRHYSFPDVQIWFYAFTSERGSPATIDRASNAMADARPISVPIADHVALIGVFQPLPEIEAGEWLSVGLAWHIDEDDVRGDWPVALRLVDRRGIEYASAGATLSGGGTADFYLPAGLFISPDTPPGRYEIVFVAGEHTYSLGTLRVRAPGAALLSDTVPAEAVPLNYRFGEGIALVGALLPEETTFHPGDSVPLTLYWQAVGLIRERYKVFVHFVGEEFNPETRNDLWGQQDQEPRGGAAVTTSWRQGQIIADDYLIPISPDAPPGAYRIEVGLYLPLGWERLAAVGPEGQPLGDHIVLHEVEVVSP